MASKEAFKDNVHILLVDDHPENLLALEAILHGLGNLIMVQSGAEALKQVLDHEFAVILLDVQMPGINGFETASLIRQRQRSSHTPIIFLTAFSTSDTMMFKGYSLGAVDYLLKPIDPAVLTSKVSVFVDLYKKNAEIQWQANQMAAMNAELRQTEERFRCLSACSPVGIFLADLDRGHFYTNPRCQSICGFTFEESMGDGWINFIYPDDRDRAVYNWVAYIHANTQTEFSDEYRYQSKDETIRWTAVRASPMVSDSGELMGHVGTVEDITERKQAEAAQAQIIHEQAARQEAERANRMKDEFLAVLSHELRTPLNAILGWSKLLLKRNLDSETMSRALETIERNAKSQANLVEDILDVSLIVQGKLRINAAPINLISLIVSILETFQPIALDKKVQLNFIPPTSAQKSQLQTTSTVSKEAHHTTLPSLMICGDAERLHQVIRNLLSNAIKFTPEHGQVEVKVSIVEGELPIVNRQSSIVNRELSEVAGQSPHHEALTIDHEHWIDYAQIQITDTGVGIAPDFLPHVFDRFRQADSTITRSYNGLGLGLAIVHHIVHLHNGSIRADSEGMGKGATFTLMLPLMHPESQTYDNIDSQQVIVEESKLKVELTKQQSSLEIQQIT